jgi:isocitrate dehydrogenase (NAD+)
MVDLEAIRKAQEHFGKVFEEQLERVERLKREEPWQDFSKIKPVVIGILGGDGIGPYISAEAQRILERLLKQQVSAGKVQFHVIDGLTIENRARHMKAIPDEVLKEIKQCHVTLKGPTHTPEQGDGWPNIESANVAMRKVFDLFANVRPVRIPQQKIDWVFFRENTEDLYALGSQGWNITEDLAIDLRLITTQGSQRIIEAAFEYAKRTGRSRVTAVTKANIVKTTEGKFLNLFKQIASRYPGITIDAWYIDIMTAKLLDPARRSDFQVLVMPNMWGDILTDEAAQIQGGVGTAGSANIGKQHAMFEAIHGSAPRMVAEGRAQYADPSSMIRAGALLMEHIGFPELGRRLERALDVCGQYERKLVLTGRSNGATGQEFGNYVVDTVADSNLDSRWEGYVRGRK